jgi:hypothetical protein
MREQKGTYWIYIYCCFKLFTILFWIIIVRTKNKKQNILCKMVFIKFIM